jgi:uncharacterized protein (DUF4415 family)
MKKRKLNPPTPEEDKQIIASMDDDSPELGDEFFANAKPAPKKMQMLTKKYRGKQKAATKEAVSIRLSPEVLETYRATGKGWQSRMDDDLKELAVKYVSSHPAEHDR